VSETRSISPSLIKAPGANCCPPPACLPLHMAPAMALSLRDSYGMRTSPASQVDRTSTMPASRALKIAERTGSKPAFFPFRMTRKSMLIYTFLINFEGSYSSSLYCNVAENLFIRHELDSRNLQISSQVSFNFHWFSNMWKN
jgi:hypothetical protein